MVFTVIMYCCSTTVSDSKIHKFEEFYGITLFIGMLLYIYAICNVKCYDARNFEKCYFIKKIKVNAVK